MRLTTSARFSPGHSAVLLASFILLGVVVALTGIASGADRAANPVSGGTTTLALKAKGLKVKAIAPATKSGKKSVILQNDGGDYDPTTGTGPVDTAGGFVLKNQDGKVKVQNITVTFGAGGEVRAKVGRKTVGLATVSGGVAGRNGFDGTVTGAGMKLTSKGAKALNKKLGGSSGKRDATASVSSAKGPFKKNKSLGSLGTTVSFKTLTVLPQGETTLIADVTPGSVFTKLAGRGVGPSPPFPDGVTPIDPATDSAGPPPSFSFPISGGTLSPQLDAGRMNTSGGVRIEKTRAVGPPPGTPGPCETAHPVGLAIEQSQLINDFGTKSVVGTVTAPGLGTTSGVTVSELDMSNATSSTDPNARTVTVSGIVVRLPASAAAILSQVFGTGAEGCDPANTGEFAAGDPLGTLEFTAHLE